MHIGEKIKHFRELRNFTQKHVADELGVSQPQYSKLENSNDISFSQLERVAEILDVRVQDLISFEPTQYFNNVQHSQIGYNFYNNTVAQELDEIKERISRIEKLILK